MGGGLGVTAPPDKHVRRMCCIFGQSFFVSSVVVPCSHCPGRGSVLSSIRRCSNIENTLKKAERIGWQRVCDDKWFGLWRKRWFYFFRPPHPRPKRRWVKCHLLYGKTEHTHTRVGRAEDAKVIYFERETSDWRQSLMFKVMAPTHHRWIVSFNTQLDFFLYVCAKITVCSKQETSPKLWVRDNGDYENRTKMRLNFWQQFKWDWQ